MMIGTVTAFHELLIRVTVRNFTGQSQDIDAILDTGFNGSLALLRAVIAALGLPWRSRSGGVLANGTAVSFDIFAATAMWDGVPRPILIQSVDSTALLGMALLIGSDLRARMVLGGRVEIEAIP